jgi:hypothetical protein
MEFKKQGVEIKISEQESKLVDITSDLVKGLYFSVHNIRGDVQIENEVGDIILTSSELDLLRNFLIHLQNNTLTIVEKES